MSYSELVKEYLKHIQAKDSIFGDIQIAENSILALQKQIYVLLSVLAKHKVTYELDHARIKTEIEKIITNKKTLELEVEALSSKNETSKLALAQEQKEISQLTVAEQSSRPLSRISSLPVNEAVNEG